MKTFLQNFIERKKAESVISLQNYEMRSTKLKKNLLKSTTMVILEKAKKVKDI